MCDIAMTRHRHVPRADGVEDAQRSAQTTAENGKQFFDED
jgi:hypothetical protein